MQCNEYKIQGTYEWRTHLLILRSRIAAVIIAGIVNVDSGGLLRIGVGLLLGLEFALDAKDVLLLLLHLPRLLQPRPYFGQFLILPLPLLFTLLSFLLGFALHLLHLESHRFSRIRFILCLQRGLDGCHGVRTYLPERIDCVLVIQIHLGDAIQTALEKVSLI